MKGRLVVVPLLLGLTLAGVLQPLRTVSASIQWSSPTLVESHVGLDLLPAALMASNETMWLAWQSNRYGGFDGRFDILYKTYTGGSWSPPQNFTTSGFNADPSFAQLRNGTILLFWILKVGASYEIFYKSFNNNLWSSGVQLTSTNLNDTLPSAAVGRDGTLWLVWTRVNTTCTTCLQTRQLFYKTLSSTGWSPEIQLTSDNNWNYGSSVLVGKDGIVRVVWSKGDPSIAVYQLYYKTYNGVAWSSETHVVSSTTTDERASLIQDRNGTMWLFWGRQIYFTSLSFYYVLFAKSSVDNGLSWSSEIQLTNTSTSIDSEMPVAIQYNSLGPKPIWIFYTSNLTGNGADFDIYAIVSSSISPIHDVVVSSITASQGQGSTWTITVRVADLGDYSESVSVSLTVFNTTSFNLGTSTGSVPYGGATNFVFTWNAAGSPAGLYGAKAIVAQVPGETLGNLGDNTLQVIGLIQYIPISIPAGGGGPPPFRM